MNIKTLAIISLAVAAGSSHAVLTFPVTSFMSSGIQNGDRTFVSTSFVGSTTTLDSSNVGFFNDGTLKIGALSYGWNDKVPGDFGPGNAFALNPDRGISATPFAGESDTNKNATVKDVFGSNNLGYLLDGEANVTWSLDLQYGDNKFIVADENSDKPELLMLERGANSRLGIRAILEGSTYSNSFIMNFNTGAGGQAANTDYTIQSTEIGSAQRVSGLGLSLDAFGLAQGTKVYGYQFFVDQNSGTDFNGPDFIGFIAGRTAPVPEPASIAALGFGLVALLKRRKKA